MNIGRAYPPSPGSPLRNFHKQMTAVLNLLRIPGQRYLSHILFQILLFFLRKILIFLRKQNFVKQMFDFINTLMYIIHTQPKGGIMTVRRREGVLSFGEKVKDLRIKKNMNQKQCAVKSKITQATISRIESGSVKQLKSDALRRLAEALGIPIDYLVDRTDTLTPVDMV